MIALLDTSAIYAFLDPADAERERAASVWQQVAEDGGGLVTHNYVVAEATALVQRRLGMEAVRVLHGEMLSTVAVFWVDERVHDRAVSVLLAAPRGLSLVDLVSFEVMRERRIRAAFAFDRDFADHGFTLVP